MILAPQTLTHPQFVTIGARDQDWKIKVKVASWRDVGIEMTNRNEGQTFSTAGRPPEGSWMDSGQTRPSWRRKAIRNTTDSGMGSMETQYGLIPPQPGARKRHADDEMLRRRYMDSQNDTNGVQWDGPHKRISFVSEDPESTLSGSESRPGWPPDDLCADLTRYKGSLDKREREGLQLVSPAV